MADYEVKAVDSGFYDAIDEDRLYAAATMNLPYKNMISDGILGEQIGDDIPGFKIHAITGRKIRIDAGNALLGGRWVENKGVTLTIPTVPSGFERIDGVFLRVDTNEDVRGATIRVREGSVTPDTSEGVSEMLIATLRLYGSADVEIADHRTFARVLVAESQLQALLTAIMEEHPELIATIPDLSVTTAKLADEAVTTDKIADNTIDAEKLANGAVTTVRLAAGAVTTEKIADGAVTTEKLANNAVDTANIKDTAVTAEKLGSDVTAAINGKLDTSAFDALGLSVSDGKLCITYDEA